MQTCAIIPALNEEQTIAAVVKTALQSSLVTEVLVVSDGSIDNTAALAYEAGARVIELPDNLGKGGAMCKGAENTSADILLFLDADLIGLTVKHIEDLLLPVLRDGYEMSVGIFEKGRIQTDLAHIFAPFLSGQRAIKREIFMKMNLELTRFGVEVALTRYCLENNIKLKKVYLPEITHVMKEEKLGFTQGFRARMKMYWEIAKCVGLRD